MTSMACAELKKCSKKQKSRENSEKSSEMVDWSETFNSWVKETEVQHLEHGRILYLSIQQCISDSFLQNQKF